ncbi:MAG: D-sedoheptulose 7-phosphate isomerase [Thermodesulfobacteriota bacterium]
MTFDHILKEHSACMDRLAGIGPAVETAARILSDTIGRGHKILVCGNGGSAADAQHFAAEIVGRFEKERKAFAAVALTTDTSILTALANDYSYDDIFARQVQGLGAKGDALVGLSTSGNSENVLRAMAEAKKTGMRTVALCGRDGGKLKGMADCAVVVPAENTARIQEAHILVIHYFSMIIETGNMGG